MTTLSTQTNQVTAKKKIRQLINKYAEIKKERRRINNSDPAKSTKTTILITADTSKIITTISKHKTHSMDKIVTGYVTNLLNGVASAESEKPAKPAKMVRISMNVIPVVYDKNKPESDFKNILKYPKRMKGAIILFNDNTGDHYGSKKGGGNGFLRAYNRYYQDNLGTKDMFYSKYDINSEIYYPNSDPTQAFVTDNGSLMADKARKTHPVAFGISTGDSNGYTSLSDDIKANIDANFEELKELLAMYKDYYTTVYYSSAGAPDHKIGVQIFKPDTLVIDYITGKINELKGFEIVDITRTNTMVAQSSSQTQSMSKPQSSSQTQSMSKPQSSSQAQSSSQTQSMSKPQSSSQVVFTKNTNAADLGIGIPNIGNSCWINAVLQMFFYIDEIKDHVLADNTAKYAGLKPIFESLTTKIELKNDEATKYINEMKIGYDVYKDYGAGDVFDAVDGIFTKLGNPFVDNIFEMCIRKTEFDLYSCTNVTIVDVSYSNEVQTILNDFLIKYPFKTTKKYIILRIDKTDTVLNFTNYNDITIDGKNYKIKIIIYYADKVHFYCCVKSNINHEIWNIYNDNKAYSIKDSLNSPMTNGTLFLYEQATK